MPDATATAEADAAAAATKAAADKSAADTDAAAKAVADKAVADKAIADKAAADKTQADQKAKTDTLLGATKIVPEKYELKMPDGSPLDQEALTRVETYAKANKLSNEEAQKLLEVENTAVKTFADKQQATMETLKNTWAEESKNDKEFGGQHFAQNVELSRRVVEKFGSPEFKKALNETGLGNHPELIRMLSRIGKAVGDDELVVGRTAADKEAPKDPAKKLYPNQK